MKNLLTVAVTAALMGSVSVSAAVSEAEFAELKAQFASMAERLSTLEAENNQLREQSTATVSQLEGAREELVGAREDLVLVKKQNSATSWADKITLKGDFRYRYEEIDVEGAGTRDRNRIRARPEIVAQLVDNVQVGFGLATGSNDPVSANQTLGEGNTSKQINLNLAYARWNPIEEAYIEAGKFKNPLFRPQKTGLLWDGDWTPEGLNVGWNSEHVFATALVNWVESDSSASNEEVAWGVQGGLKFDVAGGELIAAAGYYDFPLKGNESYYRDRFFGNSFVSVNGVDVYEYDYELVELSALFVMNLFDMPVTLFGDYVQNQDPDDYDTGWLAGVQLGKASGRGTWQLAYQYQDLEADAALGLLTDSNFAGGGTDGKGSRVSGAYGINKQWTLGFTWFVDNEAGEKAFKDEGGAVSYDRFIVDTVFKY
jgi:outer membrane murein-binding lipoprotein Lpp